MSIATLISRMPPVVVIVMLLTLQGCTSQRQYDQRDISPADREKTILLLKQISALNSSSVDSYTGLFSAEGILGKNKFNAEGDAVFNKNPRLMKLAFTDAVFRTLLTVMVQDGDSLKFYFPTEKTVYVDNLKTIRLKNYLKEEIDFRILYPLIAGQIPLIPNYKIKSGLTEKTAGDDAHQSYVILENAEYFQTIGFQDGMPEKILFIEKAPQRKTEVYLGKTYRKDGVYFYKQVLVVFVNAGKLSIAFKNMSYNIPIDQKAVLNLKLANDTRFVNMSE